MFPLPVVAYYSWHFWVSQSLSLPLSLQVHLLNPSDSVAFMSLQVFFRPLLRQDRPLGSEQVQTDCSIFQSESNHQAHMRETS